jgi:hypothetical protein
MQEPYRKWKRRIGEMLPTLTEAETVSVIGPIASGKTHLLKKWITGIEKRFVIFDPTAEYDDIPGEHFWATPKAYAQYMQKHPHDFRAIYHPSDTETAFTTVVSALWQMHGAESKWLFIEEIHELMSPFYRHEKMRILMKYARKRLIGMIGATQAIADLHKDYTRASRMVILFWTQEVRDLEAIGERWGNEAREMVVNLKPLLYDDVSGKVNQIPEAVVIRRGEAPRIELMQ